MPIKGRYYKSTFMPGIAILVLAIQKRAVREFELAVDWYRFDDDTKKWLSMGENGDVVVNLNDFSKEWRELAI